MKQTPILFSTDMVPPTLAGIKTMTRRTRGLETFNALDAAEWQYQHIYQNPAGELHAIFKSSITGDQASAKFPYGVIGDILWVRETTRKCTHYGFDYPFYQYKDGSTSTHCEILDKDQIIHDKWTPSIHMPKDACRLWLKIFNLRVEKLKAISDNDAVAEGIILQENGYFCWHPDPSLIDSCMTPAIAFKHLWRKINGIESWERNPWTWVIEFKRIPKPQPEQNFAGSRTVPLTP